MGQRFVRVVRLFSQLGGSLMKLRIATLFTAWLVVFHTPAAFAEPLRFDLPVKCQMGVDCFVQNYVDIDPTKGKQDYQCGTLTYNNHKGTDIRVRSLREMDQGVAVVAGADGVVANLRTGVADHYFQSYSKTKQAEVKKIGLGNVVILKHRDGYTTAYAHMKKGSIRVKKGEHVKRGQMLGHIGLSGFTAFPHLHFAVRHKKSVIDPFSGPMASTPCDKTAKSLWSEAAATALNYQPSGFLLSGFASERPAGREEIETGRFGKSTLQADAPMLIFFSYLFGLHPGDLLNYTITDPEGKIIAKAKGKKVANAKAVYMNYIGKRRPKSGWRPGKYLGEARLTRGDEILRHSATVEIAPRQ